MEQDVARTARAQAALARIEGPIFTGSCGLFVDGVGGPSGTSGPSGSSGPSGTSGPSGAHDEHGDCVSKVARDKSALAPNKHGKMTHGAAVSKAAHTCPHSKGSDDADKNETSSETSDAQEQQREQQAEAQEQQQENQQEASDKESGD